MSRHPEAILENNLVSQLTGLRYARCVLHNDFNRVGRGITSPPSNVVELSNYGYNKLIISNICEYNYVYLVYVTN